MKEKIFVVCMAVICIMAAAKGTLSYFTSEGVAHNVITTGNVKIEIIEKQKVSSGGAIVEEDFPAGGISGAMPDDTISKIVRIKNTGHSDAWVRIKADTRIKTSDDSMTMSSILSVPKGGGVYATEPAIMIHMNGSEQMNQTAWTKNTWTADDGYYYYRTALSPGAVTEPLFEEVTINPNMSNDYHGCRIHVDLTGYGVQAKNNGSSIGAVQGWPE